MPPKPALKRAKKAVSKAKPAKATRTGDKKSRNLRELSSVESEKQEQERSSRSSSQSFVQTITVHDVITSSSGDNSGIEINDFSIGYTVENNKKKKRKQRSGDVISSQESVEPKKIRERPEPKYVVYYVVRLSS